MLKPRERLIRIRYIAGMLRQHSGSFPRAELESVALAIEHEAELALADLTDEEAGRWGFVSRPLSVREIEVLKLVSDGLPDKQIAKRLGISTFTVNKHVSAILEKMHAASRTEASVRAITEGFVRPRAS